MEYRVTLTSIRAVPSTASAPVKPPAGAGWELASMAMGSSTGDSFIVILWSRDDETMKDADGSEA
jgi:hypothetical protein